MPYIIQSSTECLCFGAPLLLIQFVSCYSLIAFVITALLMQKGEFGYTPIRQPIHFKQMTAKLLLSDAR